MIRFGDQRREIAEIRPAVLAAVERVLDSGWFILGPEVEAFEREFAAWIGVPHAVGTGSGTDALTLALRALGIGPGNEVIVPANTCFPTAAGVAATGARIRVADCDPDTLMLAPEAVERAVTPATRAIVPVHLYGNAADMAALGALADRHDLRIVEDCAQAAGTRVAGRAAGALSDAAAFSFYPTKNLGAYGDGGCVVTASPEVAERVRQLRNYGYRERDCSETIGANSRLDPVQAAILRVKLAHVDAWNARRSAIASRYIDALAELAVRLPSVPAGVESAYHLFVITTPERDRVRAALAKHGLETLIHYPRPLHMQPSLGILGYRECDFPHAERACAEVLSIPNYPHLRDEEIDRVIEALSSVLPRST